MKTILFFIYLFAPKFTSAILNGVLLTDMRIHDRSQVFINGPFGPTDLEYIHRHSMGVLINERFVASRGSMFYKPFGSVDFVPGFTVRINCFMSFHGCPIKEVDWWSDTFGQSIKKDDKFTIILLRLATPYREDRLSNLAFMQVNSYAWTQDSPLPYHVSGFQGNYRNWLNHQLNYMYSKHISWRQCIKDYSFMGYWNQVAHIDDNLLYFCFTDKRSTDDRDKRYPYEYDDGAGVFVEHTNLLQGLAVGRAEGKPIRSSMATLVMRYQASAVQKLRGISADFYQDFSENIFNYPPS